MSQIKHLLRWRAENPERDLGIEYIRRWQRQNQQKWSAIQRENERRGRAKRITALRKSPKVKEVGRHWGPINIEHAHEGYANSPRCRPGVQNIHAKDWIVRDPTGKSWKFRNLAEFIRTHSELFDPSDIIWEPHNCRALKGISSLRPTCRCVDGTWKGWTWAATNAVETNEMSDLLMRV